MFSQLRLVAHSLRAVARLAPLHPIALSMHPLVVRVARLAAVVVVALSAVVVVAADPLVVVAMVVAVMEAVRLADGDDNR